MRSLRRLLFGTEPFSNLELPRAQGQCEKLSRVWLDQRPLLVGNVPATRRQEQSGVFRDRGVVCSQEWEPRNALQCLIASSLTFQDLEASSLCLSAEFSCYGLELTL